MRKSIGMVAAAVLLSGAAHAQIAGDKVKIGVLTDMSGIFSVGLGTGMVTTTKMAVEDFGGKINGVPIEIVSADHQNKPDVATSIASRWYDADGVNVITDVGITSVAFAVAGSGQGQEQDRPAGEHGLGRLHGQGLRAQ